VNKRDVVLINPGGFYAQVVARFTSAIQRHLPSVIVENTPSEGSFNVHFFRERIDAETRQPRKHPDLYIAHGWCQKLGASHYQAMDSFRFAGVPGPMVEEFLVSEGMKRQKIAVVGHPGMDDTINGWHTPPINDGGKPRLVVAFTHTEFINYWNRMDPSFKEALREKYNVIEVTHPAFGWMMSRDYIKGAAVVLSEKSGTIFEAWTFGVPVVFPTWAFGSPRFKPGAPLQQIYTQEIGYHVGKAEHFRSIIDLAAEQGITPEETKFIDEYFPAELRGNSGEVAANAILERL